MSRRKTAAPKKSGKEKKLETITESGAIENICKDKVKER